MGLRLDGIIHLHLDLEIFQIVKWMVFAFSLCVVLTIIRANVPSSFNMSMLQPGSLLPSGEPAYNSITNF